MTSIFSPNIEQSLEGLDSFLGHVEVAPNVYETRQSDASAVATRLLGTPPMTAQQDAAVAARTAMQGQIAALTTQVDQVQGQTLGDLLDEIAAGQTVALPANTYANGAAGVGATITANANGALAASYFDAVAGAIAVGKRLWVRLEGAKCGLYTLTQVGDATHPFILTRAADADTAAELGKCRFGVAAGGATFGGKSYQC